MQKHAKRKPSKSEVLGEMLDLMQGYSPGGKARASGNGS